MIETSVRRLHLVHVAVIAFALLPLAAVAQQGGDQHFTGTLVDRANLVPGTATRFELHLEGYTTPAELRELERTLEAGGQSALQDALWERDLGYIRIGANLGYPVSVALSLPREGGRTVYAVMDRPMQLFEIWRGLRSRNYPFSVVELRVDDEGNGEGSLYAVSKVFLGDGMVVVENLHPQPFGLLDVERQD